MQIYNSSNLYTAAHIIHDEIDFFTASLWFLKDNACSTAMLHLYCSEAETAFNKWRTSGQSNSKGEYEVVEFKERELNEALHISNRFRSIITSFRRVDSKQFHMDVDFSRTTRSSFVEEPYNNHDRIGRAFSFISLARQSSLLPLKISLYVASFECLFTNDHSEVTHKVSERGAFYLANDRIEALGIFKTLKAGYAVRSSYLHGQKVAGGTKEKLQDTSTKMDALCRRLFRKILDDHTPFTLNDQELQKWFDQLLFG
ncbi:HEPN domain-containing protein [Chryseosolibacter histidini]|nr:HEPN domain-containing protein [Chryseosolibacter histidini]